MKKTVTEYEFRDRIYPDNWLSPQGLKALWDYLAEYEDGTGEELELDVIGICCDFTGYADLAEFREAYSGEYETLGDVEDRTVVIRIPGEEGFIIQIF